MLQSSPHPCLSCHPPDAPTPGRDGVAGRGGGAEPHLRPHSGGAALRALRAQAEVRQGREDGAEGPQPAARGADPGGVQGGGGPCRGGGAGRAPGAAPGPRHLRPPQGRHLQAAAGPGDEGQVGGEVEREKNQTNLIILNGFFWQGTSIHSC